MITITAVHTQGPWVVVPDKPVGQKELQYLIIQNARNAHNVGKAIPCFGMTKEEVEANAQLMAASPNLARLLVKLYNRNVQALNDTFGIRSFKAKQDGWYAECEEIKSALIAAGLKISDDV